MTTGRWTLQVVAAEGGLVPTIGMIATRGSHTEYFDVGLWPSGWRILRQGLTLPATVRTAAIRLAAAGTGLGKAA